MEQQVKIQKKTLLVWNNFFLPSNTGEKLPNTWEEKK